MLGAKHASARVDPFNQLIAREPELGLRLLALAEQARPPFNDPVSRERLRWLMGDIKQQLDAAHAAPVEPNPFSYVAYDQEFWDREPPPFLVPRTLTVGDVGVIYCGPGQGKSLVAQDIAVGFAVRKFAFGALVELGPVLYLDHENSETTWRERLEAFGLSDLDSDALRERLHYSLLGSWSPLDTPAGAAALLAEVERTGAVLVIIDTLSKVVSGPENANDTWAGLHNAAMKPLKRLGVSVLQLDHTGKDEDRGQRGGSAKLDNVDVAWFLTATKDGRYVQLTSKKDRSGAYGGQGATVDLERRRDPHLEHVLTGVLPVAAAQELDRELAIAQIISDLDDLDVPLTAGRNACREALRISGRNTGGRLLNDAVKERKNYTS